MQNDPEVLIVGGGPTGLVLAAELALARVDVVIIERRPNQDLPSARAGGLHARTIEELDQRGIAERFLAAGQTMQIVRLAGTPLDIGDFPTRHGYGLALRQAPIERLLAARAEALGVPIHRACDVIDVRPDGSGVDVALSDGRTLRARWVVGCDGGRSLVRKSVGIAFPGWDPSITYLLAEATMAEAPPIGIRQGALGINAIGPLDGGRVGIVLIEPEVRSGDEPTLDELRTALVAAYGTDYGIRDVTWLSRFSDAARQAASYRAGHVLLAGDAAHVHSPTGGQGLNLGVQDAMNLGWKLAQVVHGVSPPDLLDSYHAERHPVGARVLETTLVQTALNRGDDRSIALRNAMAALLRMDEPRKRTAGMLSGLDIHYELGAGHPLLGRRMPDLEVTTANGSQRVFTMLHEARPICVDLGGAIDLGAWADRVRRVEARYAGAWELPVLGMVSAPTAVLIRPDGYVAWVGEGTSDGLADALARWFGPARA